MKKFYLTIGWTCMLLNGIAQIGVPDPIFGTNGLVRTDFISDVPLFDISTPKIIPAPDGSSYFLIGLNGQAVISHRNADGGIDMAFGVNGYTLPVFIKAGDVILQTDGKIVMAGTSSASNNVLVRYNNNGTLDLSFGINGKIEALSTGSALTMALQPDGKIITAGGDTAFLLTRYNSDGSLDLTFDGDGKVETPFLYTVRVYNPGGYSQRSSGTVLSLALQSDGKIIAAGHSINISGSPITAPPVFTLARYNSDGSLDTSFNGNGKIQGTYGGLSKVYSVAVQNDGKIVAAGGGSTLGFLLARYNSNGSLDTSFDGDGKVQTTAGPGAIARSLAIQTDGKILAAGSRFTLVRYNNNGSLDISFDGDGKAQTTFLYNGIITGGSVQSMGLYSDGKIIAVGSPNVSTGNIFAIAQYNTDGSLNTSFDQDGTLTENIKTGNSVFICTTLQDDGKILAAGNSNTGMDSVLVLARYHSDGSIDSSFNQDGKVIDYTGSSVFTCITLQGDGRIVAAGNSNTGIGGIFTLARYNSDGSIDSSFDGDGKVQTSFLYSDNYDFNANAYLQSVVQQSDGKIIAAGYIYSDTGYVFALARYNTDGSLDNSFNGNGKLRTSFLYNNDSYSDAYAQSIIVQTDGKILAGGYSNTGMGHVFTMARYNTDGSLDVGFNGNGKVQTSLPYDGLNSEAFIQSITLQRDGKIVAAGYSTTDLGYVSTIVRYNNDGSLDTGFDEDGKVQTPFILDGQIYSSSIYSVTVQGNGKIIAAGQSNTGTANIFTLSRYNSNGSLDSAFDEDGKFQIVIDDLYATRGITVKNSKVYVAGNSKYYGTLASLAVRLIDASDSDGDGVPDDSDCQPNDISKWRSDSIYIDADGDGYTTGKEIICYGTTAPAGYSLSSLGNDCNDTKANIHPGSIEICGNGIDDDCDGSIDEGCPTTLPKFSINNVSATEGNSGIKEFKFVVKLNVSPTIVVQVHYSILDSTTIAGNDYSGISGTLTFATGQTTDTIRISINGDAVVEPDEYMFVQLNNPVNATITTGRGIGTIRNDDNYPAISITNYTIAEGNDSDSTLQVKVRLNRSYPLPVSVNYATQDSTATAGVDYISSSETLTFNPGDTLIYIPVTIKSDRIDEPNEIILINLTNPVNATLGANVRGRITIVDNDPLPQIIFTNTSVAEGSNDLDNNISFTVRLNKSYPLNVTVNYQTQDSTATNGVDYQPVNGTITFMPGDTLATFTIPIRGDRVVETNEVIKLMLSSATNATINSTSPRITITNDDSYPAININNVSATEGDAEVVNGSFTVRINKRYPQDISLQFTTADVTAVAGTDYIATSGTITFTADGDTLQTINIPVLGDLLDEANETFKVQLSNPINATIAGSGLATGTITDNDPVPAIRIYDTTASEVAGHATLRVTLNTSSGKQVSVVYKTQEGTAVDTLDYTRIISDTLVFQPGEIQKTIIVSILSDAITEGNETFSVILQSAVNGTIAVNQGGDNSGLVTILNSVPASGNKTFVQIESVDKSVAQLQVITSPNPFQNKIRFNVVSPETGILTILVYDVRGVLIGMIKQNVTKYKPATIEYRNNKLRQAMLFYRIYIGKQSATGKIIQIN